MPSGFRWIGSLALVVCELVLAAPGASQDGWSHYAGDTYQRYSSLGTIDATNVADLRVAWRRPGMAPEVAALMPDRRPGAYHKSTPILIDGVLYASNAVGLVEAFDPGTGETIWLQPLPPGDEGRGQSIRGVELWSDGADRRIISIRDDYLYALDADTGRPIPGFGTDGRVLLTRPEPDALRFGGAQAPLVVGDVIVVTGMRGGAGDRSRTKEREPANIHGYDVRTGRELWAFNVVPRPGEVGADTWENDAWEYAGDLAAWCCLSADAELGLVYVPLTANSGSMWGGWRPGNNLFTNTLVALDAESGRLVWHYQTIHHGVWEYDNIGVPLLADLTVEGETVPAVILTNKNAFLYVLNRETGEPVHPIPERPVPQEPKVPGEILSPTQPIPTWPAPFDRQGITEDDLIDFTPELRADALEFVEDYVLGALYTPATLVGDEPGEKLGTISVPGSWGSANWNSTAYDPELETTFVASHTLPGIAGVGPPSTEDLAEGATMEYVRVAPSPIFGPNDLPLTKPPYGRMTAIDMRTGQVAWMKANGDGPRNHPLLRDLILPPLGYSSRPVPLVTATLLFLGEGSDAFGGTEGEYQWGTKFRAYDKRTGGIVWETDLRIGTTGGPMTYAHQGKQYIVIPVGDREHAPEWIALSLP